MDERDPLIERAVETLKERVHLDAAVDRRIMAAVGRQRWGGAALRWIRRGRPVSVSPLGGLGLAAAVVLLLLVQWWWLAPREGPATVSAADAAEVVQFVLVAPGAAQVTLVGDFNDWDTTATPMRTVPGNGVWTVTVPLDAGRYRYSFVVDGTTWVQDPSAPAALEDDFGRPNSVVTVRGS